MQFVVGDYAQVFFRFQPGDFVTVTVKIYLVDGRDVLMSEADSGGFERVKF